MKICNNCIYLSKQKKPHAYVCNNSKSKQFKIRFSHSKTRKACNLYTAKRRKDIDFSQMKGMRFIEDYRDKFQDSDIWVLGCDPNLDCYPDDFFDDKVSITVNYACVGFPNSTYFGGNGGQTRYIKNRCPHLLNKCINSLSLVTPKRAGMLNWWETWGLDPIYMRLLTKSSVAHTQADFEKMGEQVFGSGPCEFVGGVTGRDYPIQAAAVLGAKRIILVGCSATCKKYQIYAQKRGMSELYPLSPVENSIESQMGRTKNQVRMNQSTVRFAEIFKKYSVEVIKHRFDEEKEEFEFVEVKSERENLWEIIK